MKFLYNGLLALGVVYFFSMFQYLDLDLGYYLILFSLALLLIAYINKVNGAILSSILASMGSFYLANQRDLLFIIPGAFFLIGAFCLFISLK